MALFNKNREKTTKVELNRYFVIKDHKKALKAIKKAKNKQRPY